MAYS
jgi:hypothetical protein